VESYPTPEKNKENIQEYTEEQGLIQAVATIKTRL
jgi:hypothetical protein